MAPWGKRFLQDVRARQQQILSWTINEEKEIDWAITQGLDGIITDNVPKVKEMSEPRNDKKYYWSIKYMLEIIRLNIWFYLFGIALRNRYGSCVEIQLEPNKDK